MMIFFYEKGGEDFSFCAQEHPGSILENRIPVSSSIQARALVHLPFVPVRCLPNLESLHHDMM